MKHIVTVEVRLQFDVETNYEDGFLSGHDLIQYMLEERGCPGTGEVGAEIERRIDESNEASICWACPLGETRILKIDGVPYVRRGD